MNNCVRPVGDCSKCSSYNEIIEDCSQSSFFNEFIDDWNRDDDLGGTGHLDESFSDADPGL